MSLDIYAQCTPCRVYTHLGVTRQLPIGLGFAFGNGLDDPEGRGSAGAFILAHIECAQAMPIVLDPDDGFRRIEEDAMAAHVEDMELS